MSQEYCWVTAYNKYETLGIPASMYVMYVFKEVTLVEDCRFNEL
jgi:hypothetical protein